MSPTIWTRCGGTANVRPLRATAHRVVEAQHVIATRHLVSSDERQALLESLIDGVKPSPDPDARAAALHYLLATPFRYRPPLKSGSRFGRAHERAIWYGAERSETALAEKSFHMLRFLDATEAPKLGPVTIEWTDFTASIRTRRGVDLTRPPFLAHRHRISHPGDYSHSQALGHHMREAGVEAFRFHSARDPDRGKALGVFTPRAFDPPNVDQTRMVTWGGTASRDEVLLYRKHALTVAAHLTFRRADFEVDGALPDPEAA